MSAHALGRNFVESLLPHHHDFNGGFCLLSWLFPHPLVAASAPRHGLSLAPLWCLWRLVIVRCDFPNGLILMDTAPLLGECVALSWWGGASPCGDYGALSWRMPSFAFLCVQRFVSHTQVVRRAPSHNFNDK